MSERYKRNDNRTTDSLMTWEMFELSSEWQPYLNCHKIALSGIDFTTIQFAPKPFEKSPKNIMKVYPIGSDI